MSTVHTSGHEEILLLISYVVNSLQYFTKHLDRITLMGLSKQSLNQLGRN